MTDAVEKYLNKYSAGNRTAEIPSGKKFKNIAVIPAIKEFENIRNLLLSLSRSSAEYFSESLFLFVINNTASAEPEIKEANQKTIEMLRGIINGNLNDELARKVNSAGLNIGVIDASAGNNALPDKEGGVGLARKIGMDYALTLFDYNRKGKNILICPDADCTVEKNYLTEIVRTFNKENLNAAYVSFEHPLPDDIESRLAIINYEIFLRYYVLGLIYSGSGYAIHTIGSTMICSAEAYIKVEGMNKKKAAEDFYFMEKLCKNYPVVKIRGTKIKHSSRGSWRVPFGTGQRVNRYLSKAQNEYLLYSPESFEILRKWLAVFNSPVRHTASEYLREASAIHPALNRFLTENNFEESWLKIEENCRDEKQLARQKHFWFDGFRTLKLIHFLRDNGIPQMEMYTAVNTLLNKFNRNIETELSEDFYNTPEKQMPFLIALREIA